MFSHALRKKTEQYIKACQDTGFASDNQMVWMLVVKTVGGERFYKNVAVCKRFKYAIAEFPDNSRNLLITSTTFCIYFLP